MSTTVNQKIASSYSVTVNIPVSAEQIAADALTASNTEIAQINAASRAIRTQRVMAQLALGKS